MSNDLSTFKVKCIQVLTRQRPFLMKYGLTACGRRDKIWTHISAMTRKNPRGNAKRGSGGARLLRGRAGWSPQSRRLKAAWAA